MNVIKLPTAANGRPADRLAALLKPLQHVAAMICPNKADADDLVQRTLLKALEHIEKLDGRDPGPWLIEIMRNLRIDDLRQQQRRPAADFDEADLPAIWRAVEPWRHMRDQEYWAAVDKLPEDLRTTYKIRCLYLRPEAEVAQMLGIKSGTVRSRVFKARLLLCEAITGTMTARLRTM